MRIWIPGGKGLVGAALKKICRSAKIDHVATGREEVDITSPQQIKEFLHKQKSPITHIINCAAYTQVDQAEQEPEQAYLVNAKGPENLGHAARLHHLKIVHLSSDYVFGIYGDRPFTENDPCQPASTYAKTKHEGENRLLDAAPQAAILRTSWVFGKGGKNFVSALLEKIKTAEAIYVTTDQKNRATYVNDLADTLLNLASYCGIFHFANQGETSRFEMAQKMWQLLQERGIPIACKNVIGVDSSSFPQIARRPTYSALDTKKIEKLLGVPPRRWESALKEFIGEI